MEGKRENKKEKEKRSYYNTGYSYLVKHPSTNPAEQGLTLLSGRDVVLSLWYSDSRLNALFVSCDLDVVKATREYTIVEKVHSMNFSFMTPPELSRHVNMFSRQSAYCFVRPPEFSRHVNARLRNRDARSK